MQNRAGTSATANSGQGVVSHTSNAGDGANFRVTYADGNFPAANDKNGDKKSQSPSKSPAQLAEE